MWGVEMVHDAKNGKAEMGSFGLRGVDPDHLELERTTLVSGRFLHEGDVSEAKKVAVVGPNIVQDLFKNEEAVGAFFSSQWRAF